MSVLRWTRDRARIAWISDTHLGIEDHAAMSIAVEIFEAAGVDHIVAGGDIFDMHAISEHPKDVERILEAGTLQEEIEDGEWFIRWLMTRDPDNVALIEGNHEHRLARFIAKHAPALYGAVTVKSVLQLPEALNVLPQGSQIRCGSLVMEHLDAVWPKGTMPGGKYPSHKLLELFPDQHTIGGHVHRLTSARRSFVDENGIYKTRGAWTMPHMSLRDKHAYAGRNANWQQGIGIIDVYNSREFDVDQIEIHRDRYDRPFALWGGRRFS